MRYATTRRFSACLRDASLRAVPAGHLSIGLDNIQLLATILGGPNAEQTARELLATFLTLPRIFHAGEQELMALPGIGPVAIARLRAAAEFGRRLFFGPADSDERAQISCPADAARLLLPILGTLEQEELHVVLMNTRGYVIRIERVYRGSVNAAAIRVAEIFRPAIKENCPAIIVSHCHPSGDPQPSAEDVAVTRQIIQAGKLMDINVMDHIVIGRGRYVSLKQRGLAFENS